MRAQGARRLDSLQQRRRLPGTASLDLAPQTPAAALLAVAMFRPVLAASIRSEKLARIEPVKGLRPVEDRRKIALKLRILGTPMTPESPSRRCLTEAEDLLHAAVAV